MFLLSSCATFEEKMPIVNALFAAGTDVNVSGENGSILHQTASQGNDEVLAFLIDKGIDLTLKDSSNRTALDVAGGVSPVGGEKPMFPGDSIPETPIYESSMAILTEAMNSQGVAIEEYMVPALGKDDHESEEA